MRREGPGSGGGHCRLPAFDVTGLYENAPTGPGAGTGTRLFATSYTGGTPEEYPKRYASADSVTHLEAPAPPVLMMTAMRDDVITRSTS